MSYPSLAEGASLCARSSVGRAELVYWLKRTKASSAEMERAARLLGYEPEPVEQKTRKRANGSEERSKKGTGSGRPNPPEPTGFVGRPVAKFFFVSKRERLPNEAELEITTAGPQCIHGVDDFTADELRPVSSEPPPTLDPLVRWARLWPVLKYRLGVTHSTGVDLPRLIRGMAEGRIADGLPRLSKARWASSLPVLIDRHEGLMPFWGDMDALCADLSSLVGRRALHIYRLTDVPGGDCIPWRQPDAEPQAWVYPPAGTPLLILSDLGLLEEPKSPRRRQWLRFGRELQRAEVDAFVLAPISASHFDPDLGETYSIARWSRESHLRPQMQTEEIDAQEAVTQLLILLSPAIRIEPALLRAVRHLLSATEFDAGVEAAFWGHPHVEVSPLACGIRPESVTNYRNHFAQQPIERQRRVLELIRAHHRHLNPAVVHEETLNWAEAATPCLVEAIREEVRAATSFMLKTAATFYRERAVIGQAKSDGNCQMGSPTSEPKRQDDETQHTVTLTRGYWMAETACSQAFWEAVMGNNPSYFTADARYPVERVSWDDVHAFIAKLNALFPGVLARLPTEAEWEYACRAGTLTPFSFGENITPAQVNYAGIAPYTDGVKGEYRERTVPVGSLPPNPWGLYEMHGNVFEWCQDRYGDYPEQAFTDPTGPTAGAYRVLRGGSWIIYGGFARSAYRFRSEPVDRISFIGFRLALGQGEASPAGSEALGRTAAAERGGQAKRGARLEAPVRRTDNGAVELVLIPGGAFLMGSPAGEEGGLARERPQHEVAVPAFYLGRYPVTNEEYARFLEANPNKPQPAYWRDRQFNQPLQPVVGISWDEARAFAAWAGARLPTEAEWEYAARAGTTTRYWWGDEIGRNHSNCKGCGSEWDGKQPSPVNAFHANAFGLHDMLGNVAEWVQDCYHDNYDAAPMDGTAWEDRGTPCPRRTLRGGSWFFDPRGVRSANRNWYASDVRMKNVGFRLAQDVVTTGGLPRITWETEAPAV